MSVPTVERAPAPRAHREASTAGLTAWLSGGRFYLVLGGLAVIVAALSLLIPSTPSYDPWSWIVWGREIVHFKLHTTGGPTWKPLPVLFTTIFAPFGRAAPDLWLIVARAGALMAVMVVFKLTLRLVGTIAAAARGEAQPRALIGTYGPAVLGALVAAVGLAFSDGFASDNALGYSEGLMTALVLIAVERHLDGRPRQAFAVGFFAALDRPELWLFWGPYGLWLFWKDAGSRKLVIGLFVLIPILWFGPEYWGSGHFFRGVNRAQHPRSNSPAFAKCPFCSELVNHAWPTVLLRIKIAAVLGVGAAASVLLGIVRGRGGGWRTWRLTTPREHALATVVMAGVLGLTWWVLIGVLTQAGFSGNDRYLVLGAALVEVGGGVAWGWAAVRLLRLAVHRRPAARERLAALAGAAVALMALVFVFVPNQVGENLIDIQRTHRALVYQAHLREDAAAAVARLGGAERIRRCGTVMTEGFQVPMLAWTMGVHTDQIETSPLNADEPGTPPNVIFQARAQHHAHLLPFVRAWERPPYNAHYTLVAHVRTFRVYSDCAGRVRL
ncbi:MAG: hypothetical protein ACYC91_05630 [Solirubrobacteraceae bacterium]